MKYDLDELDRGIIKHLSNDGRLSFTELSIRLQVTEKTIRLRYKSLIDKKIFEVVGVVNPVAVGLKAGAIIQVKVKAKSFSKVIEKLKEIREIRFITLVSGEYPILFQVSVKDQERITEILQEVNKIEWITETNTIIQLEVYKNTFEYNF
ncbi:Lrp/AsnC family transcriptional regulator [Psychrobacillus sp. NPDC093180]|uniref:Lrp/AsnC family transcriptional regulator n=1 Tax=Psychrobacillus sp. NPDC093180 TaxID=3364489 RepID=UPI003827401E